MADHSSLMGEVGRGFVSERGGRDILGARDELISAWVLRLGRGMLLVQCGFISLGRFDLLCVCFGGWNFTSGVIGLPVSQARVRLVASSRGVGLHCYSFVVHGKP